jgi:hypothetical protein
VQDHEAPSPPNHLAPSSDCPKLSLSHEMRRHSPRLTTGIGIVSFIRNDAAEVDKPGAVIYLVKDMKVALSEA